MERKYELTDETREVYGHTLHRIVAVRSFGSVKAGDKGGWIEKESNLSHEGNCWVYDDAMVFADAMVASDAYVCGKVNVYDNAAVFGSAHVHGSAVLYGEATVSGNAFVYGSAQVFGYADVYENAYVRGNATVCGWATVFGYARICESAKVCGYAEVSGDTVLCKDAVVRSNRDYIVFKNWWSSGRYFTWTRSNNKWRVGCFYGTGEKLIRKAYRDSEESGREYERIVRYVEEIIKDNQE